MAFLLSSSSTQLNVECDQTCFLPTTCQYIIHKLPFYCATCSSQTNYLFSRQPFKCAASSKHKTKQQAAPQPIFLTRRNLLITLCATIPLSTLANPQPSKSQDEDLNDELPPMVFTQTSSGLEYYDFRVGSGPKPVDGSACTLRWTGRLADRFGWPFERQGMPGDDPLMVVLGKDRIIEGLRQGLLSMRCGGKRRLYIPAKLGYTDEKIGPVPRRFGDRRRLFATVLNNRRVSNAGDLVLDIELLKCKPPASKDGI